MIMGIYEEILQEAIKDLDDIMNVSPKSADWGQGIWQKGWHA